MTKSLMACLAAVVVFFGTQSLRAQSGCYVRLTDASGYEPNAMQLAELEQAAAALCAVFDSTGFSGQFKVYDFGFYLHHETTEGGYPEPFARKVEEVAALSPYYLLFGKETNTNGVHRRIWVDVKLPDTSYFECLEGISREILISRIKSYTESGLKIGFGYHTPEIIGMDTLKAFITKQKFCCDTNRRTNSECSVCPSDYEVAIYLKSLGFKAYPIIIVPQATKGQIDNNERKYTNNSVNNFSATTIIKLIDTEINIETNINEIYSAIDQQNYSIFGALTSNESFCNLNNIEDIKSQLFDGQQDVKFWFHLLKKTSNNESDLLLLLDRSKYIVEWFDPEYDENNICNLWFTPFNFAGTQPIEITDDSIPTGLGFWEKISNSLTNKYSYNRAIKFAETNSIPREDIFFYDMQQNAYPKEWVSNNSALSWGYRTFALISDYNEHPIPYIHKHIFRETRLGCTWCAFGSDCCDSKWDTWDLYWDSESDEPVLTEEVVASVEGYMIVDFPCGIGTGVKAGAKGVIYLAKKGSGATATWVVYKFLTATGRYVGITVDFTRRMREHGSKILGIPTIVFENIPDKITARGLEQIVIEHGRMTKVLTEQIDSIRKTRPDRLSEGVEKAVQYIIDNYPNKLSKFQEAIEYLRTFY